MTDSSVLMQRQSLLIEPMTIEAPNSHDIHQQEITRQDRRSLRFDHAHSPLRSSASRHLKRSVDLILVVFGGCMLTPLILTIAGAIKWSSPGSVFFTQERIGRDGKPFTMWKFRTMRKDAEQVLQEYLSKDPRVQAVWNDTGKLEEDPRIIAGIGRFLRKSRLDELPQLWNVLSGDMSLVGPRPLPQYHLQQLDPDFIQNRHRVTPGMTGMWQVVGAGDGNPDAFEKWDHYYIQHWSLWLDLKLLLKTCRVMLRGEGK